MGVPNWDNAGVAQQLGLDEPALRRLIAASQQAGDQMTLLSQKVNAQADEIRRAIQSDAGARLQFRVAEWHRDFSPVINSFVGPGSLTDRSTKLLNAMLAANKAAEDSASS